MSFSLTTPLINALHSILILYERVQSESIFQFFQSKDIQFQYFLKR